MFANAVALSSSSAYRSAPVSIIPSPFALGPSRGRPTLASHSTSSSFTSSSSSFASDRSGPSFISSLFGKKSSSPKPLPATSTSPCSRQPSSSSSTASSKKALRTQAAKREHRRAAICGVDQLERLADEYFEDAFRCAGI